MSTSADAPGRRLPRNEQCSIVATPASTACAMPAAPCACADGESRLDRAPQLDLEEVAAAEVPRPS